MSFIWICMSLWTAGHFYWQITGNHLLKGDFYGFRDEEIENSLFFAVGLEPLNLFFYTWRFLKVIQEEEQNTCFKHFLRYFEIVTILFLPPTFYAIFVAFSIEKTKYIELITLGQLE